MTTAVPFGGGALIGPGDLGRAEGVWESEGYGGVKAGKLEREACEDMVGSVDD